MKITAIKQQLKNSNRYSIFIEGKYEFSLSADGLLEQKLVIGQELDEQKVRELKRISDDDKIYNAVLRFIAIRARSKWEIQQYLERKKAPPPLSGEILNKLSINGLIDDKKFAQAYVNDRRLLRPTSRRKMVLELQKKHIDNEIIGQVLAQDEESRDAEQAALIHVIERKRRQQRYQDDQKLMQYLASQGFHYGDIKSALAELEQTD